MKPARSLVASAAVVVGVLAPASVADAATTTHTDKSFTIRLQPGWKVRSAGGAVVVSTPEGGLAVARPFVAPAGRTPSACASDANASLGGLVPGATAKKPTAAPGRPADATASLTYRSGIGALLCHIDGRAGMAYAVAAPAKKYASLESKLVASLSSLAFRSGGAAVITAGPSAYVAWRDPREGAFTVQVPKGWTTTGGMFRQSAIDLRPVVQLQSPDDEVLVTSGDTTLGFFTPPSPLLEMGGIREGMQYNSGFGSSSLVLRYFPGTQFAARYLQTTIGKVCTGATVLDSRDRPDISGPINSLYAANGLGAAQVAAGEISFSCTAGGEQVRGWQFAQTVLVSSGGSQIWQVERLVGYLASPSKAAVGQAVASKLASSFAYEPAWFARQQQTTSATSRIVSEAGNAISKGITDSYWTRQRTNDKVFDDWSKATLGLTDVRDPATGETWRVESGRNYYWRNGDGSFGAGDKAPPSVGLSLLEQVG